MYMDYGYKYIFVIYTDVYIYGLRISGYICNIYGCCKNGLWISGYFCNIYGCINIWITDIRIYLQYIRMYTCMDYGYQDIFAIYPDVYIYELWILGYICNICECIHIWITDIRIYLQYIWMLHKWIMDIRIFLQYIRMYTYMDYGYLDILQKYGCINIWITDIRKYLQYIRMYTYMDYGYQDIFAIYTNVYTYMDYGY